MEEERSPKRQRSEEPIEEPIEEENNYSEEDLKKGSAFIEAIVAGDLVTLIRPSFLSLLLQRY